jgi:two-component system, LytTR family, response regulator
MASAVVARSVLIADDEPRARERIRMLLEPHTGFRVVGEAGTGDETLEQIRGERPDIVFLDISMPGRTGVQVAQELLDEPRAPAVVFVTAHDEFAVQAFEVSAIDYLVKPIDRERFEQMLSRVERRLSGGDARSHRDELSLLLETLRAGQDASGYRKRFVVRTAKGHHFVLTRDVECAVAEGNYVALHAGGRQHLVRETMKSLEDSIDPAEFVRIHRSVIVRIDAIARVEAGGHGGEYRVHMKGGASFHTSRGYSERVRALLR